MDDFPGLEQEIRLLEAKSLDPKVRSSPEALAGLLADDFCEFGSSGRVYNKRQIVEALQQGAGDRYALEDFQVRLLGPGVALATYRSARFTGGQKEPVYALRSSIWKFEAGRWQMTFHQGTPTQSRDR